MSTPIDYTCIAELHEAIGSASAAHFRASANGEAAEELADLRDADRFGEYVYGLLDSVPEPVKSVKHSDGCWQRHAWCLAELIRNEV